MAAAAGVVATLRAAGQTVAVAESLTGGQVAAAITSVPGASVVFRGGVVAYASDVKVSVLGVEAGVVAEHGVVSAECAAAMARGVRRLLGATWGLATTGVAGPEAQEGKPVGLVYVAVAGPEGHLVVEQLSLLGTRAGIQAESVDGALALLTRVAPG